MIALRLISDFVPPLRVDDTGELALMRMHEYNANNMAVVDGKKYAGLISMEEVINMKHLSLPLSNFINNIRKPFVLDTAHVFDIMKAAVENNVRVVPVIDEEENYVGLISAESCLRAFATLSSISSTGGIIELEKSISDFSLTEIIRIVEENEAQVLSLYTNADRENGTMQITVKLNKTELHGIIAAFERYEYQITGVFNETEYTEDMKEHYDALMRYLNV